jgi:hypothetical protein
MSTYTTCCMASNPIFHTPNLGKFLEIINLALKCIVLN